MTFLWNSAWLPLYVKLKFRKKNNFIKSWAMGDVIQARVFQVGENGGRKFIYEATWQP